MFVQEQFPYKRESGTHHTAIIGKEAKGKEYKLQCTEHTRP